MEQAEQNNKYVYRHIRLDCNTPFYIGIGTRNDNSMTERTRYDRAHCTTGRRTKKWFSVYAVSDIRVDVLLDGLTLDEAQEKEQEFVSLYGMEKQGGSLVNQTKGGDHLKSVIDTSTGKIYNTIVEAAKDSKYTSTYLSRMLDGTRRNFSSFCLLHKYLSGQYLVNEIKPPMSEYTRNLHKKRSIGSNNPACKQVIHTESGKIYPYAKICATENNIPYKTFINKLNGKRPNRTGFEWHIKQFPDA
jgi:hypothetical protein